MSQHPMNQTRRAFLKRSALATGGLLGTYHATSAKGADSALFTFGVVTDVHHADIPTHGTRYYRDSQWKLGQAIAEFNKRKPSFVIELGDLIDAGSSKEADFKYLKTIRKEYEKYHGPRYYVLGNHCVGRLTKKEFLSHCGTSIPRGYYSFDQGPYHFVVLDGDFKKDGTSYSAGNFNWTDTWLPSAQQKWLADDLKKAGGKKTIVFIHQNLHNEDDPHGVKNAPEVRRVLQRAGNVLAVFQGHMHTGGYANIEGIHYCTLQAMVEQPKPDNNSYAMVTLGASNRISIEGFGHQSSRVLS